MNENGSVRTAHATLGSAGEAGCRVRRAHHFELNRQHDLADMGATFHQPMGFGSFR